MCLASLLPFPFPLHPWMFNQMIWYWFKTIPGANVDEHGGQRWAVFGVILT